MVMYEYELPDNYDDLKNWLSTKEEEQRSYAEKIPELSKEIQGDLAAERELMVKVQEIVRKRKEKENIRDLFKKQAKSDQVAISNAKRRLEQFASERAIEERIQREAEEFDNITQHYMWREFAFDHQLSGARRLASARRGILGDKRGLGKSLTALIWADMLGAKKVLVFAPKDVLDNFKREITHWTPHRNVTIISGKSKVERDLFLSLLASQEQFTVLCNYEAWRKDSSLIEAIKNLRADTVIIDEAHNIKTKRTSAYRGIRDIVYADNQCDICAGKAEVYRDPIDHKNKVRCADCLHEPRNFGDFCSVKNVLPMTGTAILNKPQDIWTLLNLIDRVSFPSDTAFLNDYCQVDSSGRWRFRYGGAEALIKRLGSRFVRRDKRSAGVQTPDQVIIPHHIEFDTGLYPDQWRVMEEIKNHDIVVMDAENEVALSIVGLLPQILRRRQAVTWPQGIKIRDPKTKEVLYEAPVTESIKMDKAMELAKEIIFEEEDRLVIFSQFKEALKEFERRFKDLGIPVVRYDGDISDNRAQEAQLDFDLKTAPNHLPETQCNEECVNWGVKPCNGYKFQVILAHYKKGGVGLNLNAARQMIILDREWNPGKEDQAFGRIDRLDNTRGSIVHTIHVENTIDSFMDQIIEGKQRMIEGFEEQHDILEQLLSALNNKDLM